MLLIMLTIYCFICLQLDLHLPKLPFVTVSLPSRTNRQGISFYLVSTDPDLFESYLIYWLYYYYYLVFGNFIFYAFFFINLSNLYNGTHKRGLLTSGSIHLVLNGVLLYFAIVANGDSSDESNWEHEPYFVLGCNELFDCRTFTTMFVYCLFVEPFVAPLIHIGVIIFMLYFCDKARRPRSYTAGMYRYTAI